jgi:hypothetical protein
MPMQNYSTFLFFVNEFKTAGNALKIFRHKSNPENLVTKMGYEPSEQSIKNILDFARSYDVIETESTGYVEMNLN